MASTHARPRTKRRETELSPALERYEQKRDFSITPEPAAGRQRRKRQARLSFVIQKHWARRLHYDFRLELNGVLLSWAVPKGPSYDPAEKRIAVHVEDHPLDYASFEGDIPPKQYGAGSVMVWDRGTWVPIGDPREGMAAGKLLFDLHGEKLAGRWELVRIAKPGDKSEQWILFKKRDAWARPLSEFDVLTALPDSVIAKPLGALNVDDGANEPVAVLNEDPYQRRQARAPCPTAGKARTPAGHAVANAANRHRLDHRKQVRWLPYAGQNF